MGSNNWAQYSILTKGLSNDPIITVCLAELPQPVEIVEDGVFWSSALEARVSPGPSDARVQDELQALRARRVTRLAQPDWVGCSPSCYRISHLV